MMRSMPNSKRRPTLRDVAAAADVSLKTASRVVNREAGVSSELTGRVEDAVRRLGYQRDDRARQLRRGASATGTIGLIQNDVGSPFFAAVFRGVERVAAGHGNLLLSASSDGQPRRQDEIVRAFISRRVDGLVLVPVGGDFDLVSAEVRRGTPVVFVDLMPPELIGDVVLSNHRGGAINAVAHLISHGHRRIAFLGDTYDFFSATERHAGYTAALERAGIAADPDLTRFDVGEPERAAAATHGLLDLPDPPTAIFAAQNQVTIGVVGALHERGVARDVAMVGFDDVEFAAVVEPGLTVAPQDPKALGRRAGELLFRRLGGFAGPAEVVTLPVGLIERGSGEIPGPEGGRR